MKDYDILQARFADIPDMPVSEEMLGAYLEGNLDADESAQVEGIIAGDPLLGEMVDDLNADPFDAGMEIYGPDDATAIDPGLDIYDTDNTYSGYDTDSYDSDVDSYDSDDDSYDSDVDSYDSDIDSYDSDVDSYDSYDNGTDIEDDFSVDNGTDDFDPAGYDDFSSIF